MPVVLHGDAREAPDDGDNGQLPTELGLHASASPAADDGFSIAYGIAVAVVTAAVGEWHQRGQGGGCMVCDWAEFWVGFHGVEGLELLGCGVCGV